LIVGLLRAPANPDAIRAAAVSRFFLQLVSRAGDCVGDGRKLLAVFFRPLLRVEVKGDLVDLATELERNVVAILQASRLLPGN
jgi:hypothetical protein